MKTGQHEVGLVSLLVRILCVAVTLSIVGCATTEQSSEPEGVSQMYYIVDTDKSFDQAAADLSTAVKQQGFGILHIHDLGTTLRSKGVSFDEQCKVFEVCNPTQAGRVLSTDMNVNMALPCRISVFTEDGKTRIGMIRPVQMLSALSEDPVLSEVAKEVEAKTIRMIDDAK